MLDIALIREKPDWLKEQILKLNDPEAAARIDNIITVDKDRRSLLTEAEAIQAQRNRLNKAVGPLRGNKKLDDAKRYAIAQAATEAIKAGDYAQAEAFITFQAEPATDSAEASALDALTDALREMGDNYNALQEKIRVIEDELNTLMLWVPNIPHESVPVAMSEDDNIAWEPEGEFYTFDFEPKPHWELGPELGIIDFERGVKIAGTRSYILKGLGARLQRALAAFFLDMALEKGYEEVYVPFMLHEEMMYGSGQFPKFRDVVYMDQDAGIYMLPTAEVAIANMHRDEILNEDQLPLYYVGHTPCFRREKTSAGRDTRGIKRVHQFQKVEMFKFTTPETSYEELESLTEAACDLARALKIPFRRLEIVTGDLGFTATKKYDVELWAPGSQEWLEVSSCSNTEDFQARRANIRYRKEGEKRLQFVHTLNGSGLALPRTVIAILENYQQADGSVKVPEVLIPYLGGQDLIR